MINWEHSGVFKTEDDEHYIYLNIVQKIESYKYKLICDLIENEEQHIIDGIVKGALNKEIEELR